jgi:hypothetical protein
MKYEVVVGTLFVAGQKYTRGQIIELADATEYGVRVQPVVEAPKPEPVKKTRSRKASVAQGVSDEDS